MRKIVGIGLAVTLAVASAVQAGPTGLIGQVKTSGWFFKDTIDIKAFDDPDYPGIACYVSSVDRSLTWDNASDSSIACRKVGPVTATSFTDREEVFAQATSPFFKYQRVDRFYDEARNVLVYISYIRKAEGENHAHAISVVPLGL